MHAYGYGLKNFNKKYQPLHNLVVFNDEIVIEDDSKKDPELQIIDKTKIVGSLDYEPTPEQYLYYEVEHKYDNKFNYKKGNKGIDKIQAEDYLIPNGYMKDLGVNNIIEDYIGNEDGYQIYKYEDKYYAKLVTLAFLDHAYPEYSHEAAFEIYRNEYSDITNYLDEVIVYSKPKSKLGLEVFALSDIFLQELKNNPDISVILFVSNDGAKIDKTHLDIDNVRDNEIVFFLERDDSYNIFGTVARVLSGDNINDFRQFPFSGIASLASLFNIDANKEEIKGIAKEHIEKKNKKEEWGILYFLGKVVDAAVGFGTWLVKETFGDGLIAIGEGIASLKFDSHRWKYYDDKGNPDPKFSPIFPGLKTVIDLLIDTKNKAENYNPEDHESVNNKEASFKDTTSKIEKKYNDFIELIPHKGIQDYLKDKLSFIPTILKKIAEIYETFINLIREGFAATLIFLNALIIGILNSLIEAIGDIISFVGMILSLPYYLQKIVREKKKGSYLSLIFELLENGIEGFVKLFSLENLNAIIKFTSESFNLVKNALSNPETIVTKLLQTGTFIQTHVDNIGYVMGYIVGFIIEEVLTALATLGAGNILKGAKLAEAFKTSSSSLQKVLKTKNKRPNFRVDNSDNFINIMVELFNKIKNFDLKKALDTLLEWIRELISTTKDLAQRAFKKLSKAEKELLTKMELVPEEFKDELLTLCPLK